jgi:hypothetical protein
MPAEERITVALRPNDVAELLHIPGDKAIMQLDRGRSWSGASGC